MTAPRRSLAALVAALALAACDPYAVQPVGADSPGYQACRASHALDQTYELCSSDAAFPYGTWIAGRIEGSPVGVFDPSTLFLQQADGTRWELSALTHPGLYGYFEPWADPSLEFAPEVELFVSAPCDQPDRWFAVRDAEGLLAAAGTSPTADGGDWSVEAGDVSQRCPDAVAECPCPGSCRVRPLRFDIPGGGLELHPSERTTIGGLRVMVFEAWSADDDATCDEGQQAAQRWLIAAERR